MALTAWKKIPFIQYTKSIQPIKLAPTIEEKRAVYNKWDKESNIILVVDSNGCRGLENKKVSFS